MNRRDFFKVTAATLLLPTLPSIVKAKPICDWLWFEMIPADPNSFVGKQILIGKGEYTTKFVADLSILQDCHGICATDEMVMLVAQNLEYDHKNLIKLWGMDFENDKARDAARESFKRVSVTPEELKKLKSLMTWLRGPHECVHEYAKRGLNLYVD